MKYLTLNSGEDEIFYVLSDIEKIRYDYAQNILDEEELQENGFKTLEMVMAISFRDGNIATFSAAGWELGFE